MNEEVNMSKRVNVNMTMIVSVGESENESMSMRKSVLNRVYE